MQAHRLSTPDTLQVPITTTTPDDAFYILKSVTTRLLTTGSLSAVEKTLQQLREVIDRDYAGVLRRKMDDVYRTAGTTRSERETAGAFIVCVTHRFLSIRMLNKRSQ